LPSIIGVAAKGETAGGQVFDGETEVAVFPGDLPANAAALFETETQMFRGSTAAAPADTDFRFVRFRPPILEETSDGIPALPHIRLDRAMQFLFGDRLR
jgi:predicted YcjX-like family ATPase